MATHSGILVWRIPWTEESDGLQPMSNKELDTTEQLNNYSCKYQVKNDLESQDLLLIAADDASAS